MSTCSTTAGSFSFLLAGSFSFLLTSTSFTAIELIAGKEECMPFFFTATDEVGTAFFPEAAPYLFLNPGGRTEMSSTSTFTATGIEGAAMEEGANHPVPASLRQWCLSGLIISKGGGGREEARGVKCDGGK